MTVVGTMRTIDDERGAVRVEDVYDTSIEDLWRACTEPERLARWIAEVDGDLRVGGTVDAVFASAWKGSLRIDVCEAPQHLLLTSDPGASDETQMEAWLTVEGTRTRLVVEERGLLLANLPFHGAGWHAHLDDLGRALVAGGPAHPAGWTADVAAADWERRWTELTPEYVRGRMG